MGRAGNRQRIAGGMEPRIPNEIPVIKPIKATPGVIPMVNAPIENGMVIPSNKSNAAAEARGMVSADAVLWEPTRKWRAERTRTRNLHQINTNARVGAGNFKFHTHL